MKIMEICQGYIEKRTSEDNGDIESFHNSPETDYIRINDIETFEDAAEPIEYAFTDHNNVRLHSSTGYPVPAEFEKRRIETPGFRKEFMDNLKKKEKKQMKKIEERKRRLRENVSFEARKIVQV